MILQPFAQCIANGKQDILRYISRIAEDKFVPQQQLAELKESIKLHHNAGSVPVGARHRGCDYNRFNVIADGKLRVSKGALRAHLRGNPDASDPPAPGVADRLWCQ